MTERILPGIGLTGYWDQGAPWKVGGDQNWLKSSVLTQLAVESATTSLPASPLNGVIYIVPVGEANANQIAARDNGAWVYMPPQEGWTAYVRDTGVLMSFDGAAWVRAATTDIQADDFGGDIEAAVAAGVAAGGTSIVIDLGAESFLCGVNTGFVTGTKIVERPNVWLRGQGLPSYNANDTALVGGSIIKGGLFFDANGFMLTNCGLDCGSAYVDAFNGGVPIEGLVGIDQGNTGMNGYTPTGPNADPPKFGLYIDNVCVLCKGTGAAGDPSDVHAVLIENYNSGYIGTIETRFGGAGTVIKSSNLQIDKVVGSGHFKYPFLIKSEDYSDASNNHVNLVIARNHKTLTPNTAVAADYDTSGVWFQAANGDCNNNRVEMVIADAVTDAVVFDALATYKCNSNSVGKLISRNLYGYPVQTRSTCNDCVVENLDHDNSLRGVLIQAPAIRCGVIDAVVKNVGQYSYNNYGVDSIFANCRSVAPGLGHIVLYAGNARFMGDFATEAGSAKPLITVNGGTYTGLFRQTGIQPGGLNVTARNLIVNGSGESITGWTFPGGGAVVTVEPGGFTGNYFKISRPTVAQAYFTQQFVTEVGKKYKVSLYQKNGSPGTARFFLGRTTYLSAEYTGGTFVALNNAAWTLYTFVFTATATACFLTIQVPDTAVSSTGIDEVKCIETPGSTLDTDTLVTGGLTVKDVPVYANNAAAAAAGLDVGRFYRTGADPDPLCVVH